MNASAAPHVSADLLKEPLAIGQIRSGAMACFEDVVVLGPASPCGRMWTLQKRGFSPISIPREVLQMFDLVSAPTGEPGRSDNHSCGAHCMGIGRLEIVRRTIAACPPGMRLDAWAMAVPHVLQYHQQWKQQVKCGQTEAFGDCTWVRFMVDGALEAIQ